MYNSPIKTGLMYRELVKEVNKDTDEQIYKAVVACGVDVDRDELLRALRYDREQYEKGYADGKAAAMEGLVRCKDCKWWGGKYSSNECSKITTLSNPDYWLKTLPEDFCSSGERRDDDA